MRTARFLLWVACLFMGTMVARADETITVSSTNADIAENLDLKAVASLFGEVSNLEELEKELNSEERHLNNLDLNGDGVVDYLRVVEIVEGNNRLIVLQAVLAKDIYQDVASIYVEKTGDTTVSVQVIGDEDLYGVNYVIEPVYIYRPAVYDWFWGPSWVCWHSPYYWDAFPVWYTFHTAWYWTDYYYHIHAFHHHHPYCSFHFAAQPHHGFLAFHTCDPYRHVTRHDWAAVHPERRFAERTLARGVRAENMRAVSANRNDVERAVAARPANAPTPLARAAENSGNTARTANNTVRNNNANRSVNTSTVVPQTRAANNGQALSRTHDSRTFGSTNVRTATPSNVCSAGSRTADVRNANTANTNRTNVSGGQRTVSPNTVTRSSASGQNTSATRSSWQSAGVNITSTPRSGNQVSNTVRSNVPTSSSGSVSRSSGSTMRSSTSTQTMRSTSPSSSMRSSSSGSSMRTTAPSGAGGMRSAGGGGGGAARSVRR